MCSIGSMLIYLVILQLFKFNNLKITWKSDYDQKPGKNM